jgi:VWFA-related protein
VIGRLLPIFGACIALNAQRADIRVEVGLVTSPCSVTDRGGAPAKNLHREDFTLRDNGRLQNIDHLWQEADLPLTIGLIVDVSGSQASFIERHRLNVAQFLAQVVSEKDRAFLVTVGPEVKLVTDLTASADALQRGVDHIDGGQAFGEQLGDPCGHACGGTALWNAVYAAARQKLRWIRGRKALIVLSDGLDTGSPHSLSDAIESAQEAETVVYAIKFVDAIMIPPGSKLVRRMAGNRGLERLTDETGGYTFPNPEGRMAAVFAKIEDDLRNLYVIGFTPPESSRDGRFHKLEVKMVRKDLIVRSRAGYYAQTR